MRNIFGLSESTNRTPEAMSEDKRTATSSIRNLKRKASDIEEAENAPDQSHFRTLPAHRKDSNHGEAAEGSAKLTTRSSLPSSVGGPGGSSSSALHPTSVDAEDERNYTPGTSFTSINRGVSREQSDAAVGQRKLDERSKEHGNLYPGMTADKSDPQAQLKPNAQRLTDIDRKHLVAAVAEVEANFQKEKWELVARFMRRAGAAAYPLDLLENEFVERTRSPPPNVTEHESHTQAWKDILWKITEAPGAGIVFTRPSPYDNGEICSVSKLSKPVTSPKGGASTGAVFERLNFQILPTDTLEDPPTGPGNTTTTARNITKVNGSGSAKPPAPDYQGFGVLVNQEPLQCNAQQIPPNIRSRMAQQENRISWPVTPRIDSSPQQGSPSSIPVHSAMSSVQVPSSEPATERPLLSQRISYESCREQKSTEPQAPSLAPVVMTHSKPNTPTSTNEATFQESRTAAKSRKAISKSNLKYMLRHRTLNEVNKNKPWDVIARECGVNAPLNEISAALEQAGFPSILYTPTGAPIFVSNPASNAAVSPSSIAYVSPYNSMSPITPAANHRSPPLPITIDPIEENDNPLSTTPTPTTQAGQNHYTGPEECHLSPPGIEPVLSKEEKDPLQDSHEKRSAAMRKAWAKRQAEGRNGRHGGPPRSSTLARNTVIGSSPIVFAAQVLAAAEAEAAPPSRTTLHEKKRASSTSPQVTPVEDTNPTSSGQGRSQLGKKRGQYKKKEDAAVEAPTQPTHYPYQNTFMFADDKPCPYACDKCGKAYTTPGGLNYHRASKPNCETETPKPRPFVCEKCGKSYQNKGGLSYHKAQYSKCDLGLTSPEERPNLPEQRESKRLSGPRIVGGARITPQEQSTTKNNSED
ncbi:hypothetical protein N7G274_000910 [Stereocaulon virgatum]|uniref:C2H2-type domain-containing protein n=1 Tax=Stereocaulon virgatum TaxID=373712 RepID=A0ABR4AQ58_9LECA